MRAARFFRHAMTSGWDWGRGGRGSCVTTSVVSFSTCWLISSRRRGVASSASRPRRSATSALCSGDPGVLGVCASVLGRAGGVCVRFKVTCDGVLGTCALALPAVPGAAGTCRARRTAACATFASTRARGSLRPVLTGMAAQCWLVKGCPPHGLWAARRKNAWQSYDVCFAASCAIRAPERPSAAQDLAGSAALHRRASRRNEEGGVRAPTTEYPVNSPGTAPTTTTRWRFGGRTTYVTRYKF